MLVFMLEDLSGKIEAVVFPDSYNDEIANTVLEDAMLIVKGSLDDRKGNIQCLVESVMPLSDAKNKLVGKIILKLNTVGTDKEELRVELGKESISLIGKVQPALAGKGRLK